MSGNWIMICCNWNCPYDFYPQGSRAPGGLLRWGVDEGLGASVRKWKEILNNDDQTFICLSSCTIDGGTHMREEGRGACPSGHISFWWTEKLGSEGIGHLKKIIFFFLLTRKTFKTGLNFYLLCNMKGDIFSIMSKLLFPYTKKVTLWMVTTALKQDFQI